MTYAEITEHKFYVAHCAKCDNTADGDGCEFGDTPEDAARYVCDYHDWRRDDDTGHLLCDECPGPEEA